MPHTLVAIYDTPAHAALAVADLELAGIPPAHIEKHGGDTTLPATDAPEPGFWARLFGTALHHDSEVYHQSLANGATVVTVHSDPAYEQDAIAILDSHAPVDMDQRAQSLGIAPLAEPTLTNTGGPTIRRFDRP